MVIVTRRKSNSKLLEKEDVTPSDWNEFFNDIHLIELRPHYIEMMSIKPSASRVKLKGSFKTILISKNVCFLVKGGSNEFKIFISPADVMRVEKFLRFKDENLGYRILLKTGVYLYVSDHNSD